MTNGFVVGVGMEFEAVVSVWCDCFGESQVRYRALLHCSRRTLEDMRRSLTREYEGVILSGAERCGGREDSWRSPGRRMRGGG
jgi:hypothetical protein